MIVFLFLIKLFRFSMRSEFDHKMAQHDVEVREARFEDYQAVMDISLDIYNGRDYLPKMFHVFLHDKNSNCFVIILNGRIVSTFFD